MPGKGKGLAVDNGVDESGSEDRRSDWCHCGVKIGVTGLEEGHHGDCRYIATGRSSSGGLV